MSKTMTCASCGRTKAYPDGFPDRTYAECWKCAWDSHIHHSHPKVVRRIKREAKKRARRLAQRDIAAAMFETERHQALGIKPTAATPTPTEAQDAPDEES